MCSALDVLLSGVLPGLFDKGWIIFESMITVSCIGSILLDLFWRLAFGSSRRFRTFLLTIGLIRGIASAEPLISSTFFT